VLIKEMIIMVPGEGPDAVDGYVEWKEELWERTALFSSDVLHCSERPWTISVRSNRQCEYRTCHHHITLFSIRANRCNCMQRLQLWWWP
jgi:hypothetical protein